MTSTFTRSLHWTPRILCAAFAAFLAVFALDVFGEPLGVQTLVALAMHLIPTAIVLVVLAIGWRWPFGGGALLILAGLAYTFDVIQGHHPLSWIAVIAGPAFVVGGLFIADAFTKRRHLVL